MPAKFAIGIDLGTTNSVVAYAALDRENPEVQLLPIPQVVANGTVEEFTSLPSFLYLAPGFEAKEGAFGLPWQNEMDYVAGRFARQKGADVPDRTVSAAKSWLCYTRVDRHEAILPWNSTADVTKVSPVTASRRYLEHLVAAWHLRFPDAPIHQQQVVLTVPASFDASARDLTREAAAAAGLPGDLILLEEPQAAMYAWLQQTGDKWRKLLKVDDSILVCDVGGGTTDLTLIKVEQQAGELMLSRQAVGNHLLVGGDNMDLTLAFKVAELFGQQGVQLDPWQSISLWHSCRNAKEALLGANPQDNYTISVARRGSKLIGGSVSVELNRQLVEQTLVDGFFPKCKLTDKPVRQLQSGFQEIGLPFESDTAITKHVAAFVSRHSNPEVGGALPTHLLFNGGVFRAGQLRSRMFDVLSNWNQDRKILPLEGEHDLDNAVAKGAAYYSWTKSHGGIRIRGGTARSYYVGIEKAGLAIPGAPRPLGALCVVPFGMEEGTEAAVPSREIGLIVGQPAKFRFFSSSVRKQDVPGTTLDRIDENDLQETDSMETTLEVADQPDESFLPVKFQSKITELGVLELWCVGTKVEGRWRLEFNVRDDAI